jgi:hypothetical protein
MRDPAINSGEAIQSTTNKALDCFAARVPRNDGRYKRASQRYCERSEATLAPASARFHRIHRHHHSTLRTICCRVPETLLSMLVRNWLIADQLFIAICIENIFSVSDRLAFC